MITPIFQGLESPEHRDTLLSVGELFMDPPPIAVSVSYKSLKARRLTSAYVEKLSKDFPVTIEAGVSGSPLDKTVVLNLQDEYYSFVQETPSLLYAIQFDHPSLESKERLLLADPRTVPVLYDPNDPMALETLLAAYGQVAMAYEGDKRIPIILRRGVTGISVAISQPNLAEARSNGFNSSLVSAWLSPGKFGEIIFWDGTKFHRGSNIEKARLLKKYETHIERTGVDMDLVRKGDAREMTRLAVHAYLSWSIALSRSVSDITSDDDEEEGESPVSGSTSVVSKTVKRIRPTINLPVFQQESISTLEEHPDGTSSIRTRGLLRSSSESVRVCDGCFLASTCPAYEPAASCAFSFPVEIRTDAQVRALLHSVVELQATRVAFARFAEEVNGGMPDPVVGIEMDRLMRITDKVLKPNERRERLTVSVESETSGPDSGTGVLSRIFGARAASVPPEPEVMIADIIQSELSD